MIDPAIMVATNQKAVELSRRGDACADSTGRPCAQTDRRIFRSGDGGERPAKSSTPAAGMPPKRGARSPAQGVARIRASAWGTCEYWEPSKLGEQRERGREPSPYSQGCAGHPPPNPANSSTRKENDQCMDLDTISVLRNAT